MAIWSLSLIEVSLAIRGCPKLCCLIGPAAGSFAASIFYTIFVCYCYFLWWHWPLWPCTIDFGPTVDCQLANVACKMERYYWQGASSDVYIALRLSCGVLGGSTSIRDAPSCHASTPSPQIFQYLGQPAALSWPVCGGLASKRSEILYSFFVSFIFVFFPFGSYLLVNHRTCCSTRPCWLCFGNSSPQDTWRWPGCVLWPGSCRSAFDTHCPQTGP